MNIYQADIESFKQITTPEQSIQLLPIAIRNEILQYQKQPDRWRVLIGKLLLLHALRDMDEQLQLDQLTHDHKGRPFFPDSHIDFNISHSGDQVVCALASGIRIGIDIEMHRPLDVEIFKRNFKDHEWEEINSSKDEHAAFFRLWAIKESIIKADGRGVEVLGKTELLSRKHALCDGQTWFYDTLDLAEGYSSSVAYQHRPSINLIRPNPLDLLGRI